MPGRSVSHTSPCMTPILDRTPFAPRPSDRPIRLERISWKADPMPLNRFGYGLRLVLAALLLPALLGPLPAQSDLAGSERRSALAPDISVAGDLVFSWSDEEGRAAGADGFDLRAVEVGLYGSLDSRFDYTSVIHFSSEEVELEEAYIDARDWLPGRMILRGGRFNLDFGKQNRIHDHDLLTIERPSVLQEYLGGSLRGTGLELQWWSPLSDDSVIRISAALVEGVEGDSHAVLGPAAGHEHGEDEDEEERPVRDFDDFSINLRAVASVDFADESTLQLGGSYLLAPENVFGLDEDDERELDRGVAWLDLTYTRLDESTRRGIFLQGEWLIGDRDFGELDDNGTPGDDLDDSFLVTNARSQGYHALAEWRASRDWAFGVSGSSYEHAEDSDEDSWDLGAHVTWNASESHQLRLGIRKYADLAQEEEGVETTSDFVAVQLQWTMVFGRHVHGVDW